MRRLTAAIAAIVLVGTPALAADMVVKMPVKAPPVLTPTYDWSGFYLGGYYGASWSQSGATTRNLTGKSPPFLNGSVDINSTSTTAGVTAGYNLQLSPLWLVGVEGDFGYLGGGQLFQEFDDTVAVGEKNRWYATLRGRIGYVTGPSLIYLTGGVGFVHVIDTFGDFGASPVSGSTTTTGGVVGAGIETKLSRNWSTKTEYLYIDGGSDHTFQTTVSGLVPWPATFSHSYQVIKTGLNYRFDGNWDGLPFFNGTMLASNHNWNGFYIGGNAGIGTSLTHVHSLPAPLIGDENVNGTGFAGGGQAGYNYLLWQKYLIGVEGDFGALAINHSVTDWNSDTPNFIVAIFSQQTHWYGTLRGRIGTTTGPALLYLTGGVAWVRLENGLEPTGAHVLGGLVSNTSTGFTWGGGTEVALDQHWSAKLESLYVNSGSSIRASLTPGSWPLEFKERFVIVRFGLDYAFN